MGVSLKPTELKKERRAAELLGEAVLAALRDKDQFRRYVITEKRGNETCTEERVFDKLDLKAVGDMIRVVRDLAELRQLVSQSRGGEEAEGGNLVILPMAAADDE